MKNSSRFVLSLASSTLLLGGSLVPCAAAQSQRYLFDGDGFFDWFGNSVDGGTDIDGDGFPDVVIGGWRANTGRIRVFSGATGALLLHIAGASGENIGYEVAFVGDVNLDGTPDILETSFGSHAPPRVYSGLDGSLLLSIPQGSPSGLSGFADINSDGIPDLRLGRKIFSGADGSLLQELLSSGTIVVLAGDINGDGVEDYIDQEAGPLVPGDFWADVRSGANGALLHHFSSAGAGHASSAGDVNADGFDDIIIGLQVDQSSLVYSGLDGSLIYRHELSLNSPHNFPYMHQVVAGMGDVDGDGFDDFAVGGDFLRLYSGENGCLLAQFVRDDGRSEAFTIVSAGDVDGDGDIDLLTGNPRIQSSIGAGTAVLFTYDGTVGQNYCPSTVNSSGAAATIMASGSPSIAKNNLVLAAGDLPAGKPGLFFYGQTQVQIPFGNGVRCVGSGGLGLFRLPVTLSDVNGCLTHVLDNTSPPFAGGQLQIGAQWNLQAWFRDPTAGGAGFNLSDGLSLVFLP